MASTIKHKRSTTASAVPISNDLAEGEIAINTTDEKLFIKNTGGDVVEAGSASFTARTATLNTQTGTSYVPVITDADVMITMDNAAANTVTIPANSSVAYPIGTKLNFMQLGAGQTSIAITTDTLNVESTLTLNLTGQYAAATAFKVAATTWVLIGNLEVA